MEKVQEDHALPAASAGASARGRTALWLGTGLLSLLPMYGFLLLGDVAWSAKERAVQELVKAQLREFSQDPLLLNILFGALPAVLSLLIGPAVGAWSDRARTPLGRRIPFLLATTPLLAASLAALAFSQPLAESLLRLGGWNPAQRGQMVIGCMSVFWALFDLFSILSNALFIALITDTVPHSVLGRFFGVFRIVSLATGAMFFYFLFDDGLPGMASDVMLVIAAGFFAVFGLVCVGVREPAYPPPDERPYGLLGRLRGEVGPSPWFHALLFAAIGIATICVLPVNVNAYNAIGQFGASRTSYGHAIAITYCISFLLALPLGWLADRVHPLRIGLVTLGLYALSMLGAWLLVGGQVSFLFWLVVHGVLAGSFLTGTAPLLSRMLPREHFSELAALSASVTAIMALILSLGMGAILKWSDRDFRLIFLVAGASAAAGTVLWIGLMRAHSRLSGRVNNS